MDLKVDSDFKRICAKLQIECCRQKIQFPICLSLCLLNKLRKFVSNNQTVRKMTSTTRKAEDIHVSLRTEQLVVPAKFSIIERLLTR